MKTTGGLLLITILLAGALVVPSNVSFADKDDKKDHDKHESIKEFKDGVILISSSTTSTGKNIKEKIQQIKNEFKDGFQKLQMEFRTEVSQLIDQYRIDHDKKAFKEGFKDLKKKFKEQFKELRKNLKDDLKDLKKQIKKELPIEDRKEVKKELKGFGQT